MKGESSAQGQLHQIPLQEDVWGSGGISPRILNFGTWWTWVVYCKMKIQA